MKLLSDTSLQDISLYGCAHFEEASNQRVANSLGNRTAALLGVHSSSRVLYPAMGMQAPSSMYACTRAA